jgi:hypothetical protein
MSGKEIVARDRVKLEDYPGWTFIVYTLYDPADGSYDRSVFLATTGGEKDVDADAFAYADIKADVLKQHDPTHEKLLAKHVALKRSGQCQEAIPAPGPVATPVQGTPEQRFARWVETALQDGHIYLDGESLVIPMSKLTVYGEIFPEDDPPIKFGTFENRTEQRPRKPLYDCRYGLLRWAARGNQKG